MKGFHAKLQEISSDDPEYLALRRTVLRDELGWAHADPGTQITLRDAYDTVAEAFAVSLGETLIGAGRLVRAGSFKQLPSGACFVADLSFPGSFVEISKCMVEKNWRGRGVFRAIVHHCLIHSSRLHVDRIFISIIDSSRGRRFLSNLSFENDERPFKFRDELISPEQDAILLWRAPPTSLDEIRRLTDERDRILSRIDSLACES